jgi:hypothetical protein
VTAVKVKAFPKTFSYGELAAPMKLAWLNKKNEELNGPVQCKDFLCDAVYSEVNKKPASIWGFKWEPGTMPLDEKFYRLSMRYPTDKYDGNNVQALLNHFEKRLGYPPSDVIATVEPNVWIAIIPKEWLHQPLAISCCLHLIRIGEAYNPKEGVIDFLREVAAGKRKVVVPKDASYTKDALKMLEEIAETGKFPKGKEYTKISVSEMHHNSGIVATSTGHPTG